MRYEKWRQSNWDRSHREGDISALTGTRLAGHLATLHCGDHIEQAENVLCIGVGMGDWVNETNERVANVWALDISPEAKVRLNSDVTFTSQLDELPEDYFDLAMSLWVAPHMSNRDLQLQLDSVVASLKLGGVFALHYKEPLADSQLIDNREGASDEWTVAKDARVLRRREYIVNMVNWAGGAVACVMDDRPSYFYAVREIAMHIKRRRK